MPEKRTKPCSSCKKTKVKCIYTSGLPCERCIRIGAPSKCQFIPKLPSLSLPSLGGNESSTNGLLRLGQQRQENFIPIPTISSHNQANSAHQPPIHTNVPSSSLSRTPIQSYNSYDAPEPSNGMWKTQMENKMASFDNKLNDLVDILKINQKMLLDNQARYDQSQQHMHYTQPQHHSYYSLPQTRSQTPQPIPQTHLPQLGLPYTPMQYTQTPPTAHLSQNTAESHKRSYPENDTVNSSSQLGSRKRLKDVAKISRESTEIIENSDFRDNLLSKDEALLLFNFFDENITQQLFGFELSKFPISEIWESSPILVCTICTISSIHHPNVQLSSKQNKLKQHLHKLCGELIYMGRPKSELEGFNTIVALILCSFWLTDSQMFTGLALQIAKEIGLSPSSPNFVSGNSSGEKEKNGLSKKDKLKLWYLLYVLDGQQSLTFNRQPLVNSNDYSLVNVRGLLVGDKDKTIKEKEISNDGTNKNGSLVKITSRLSKDSPPTPAVASASTAFTDLRLVSQVEYNQALNEAFNGDAWDLLAPSSFGIPSKSNLELDKWMVSWTVLLSPVNNGAVWSSKSTLIYYNFAKMHINSKAVRQLQFHTSADGNMLPKWNASEDSNIERKIESLGNVKRTSTKVPNSPDSEEDSEESDDDEDEFISNKELVSEDESVLDATIAVNAASTVINLVVNDNDILNNLKYVPVHIHIMLYYAALLLINPPSQSDNKLVQYSPEKYYEKVLTNLKTVKKLQKKIYLNLPIDKSFGNRLINSLEEVFGEKVSSLKRGILSNSELDSDVKSHLANEINRFIESDESKVGDEFQSDADSSKSASPAPEKIFAWPGSNHGHPSVVTKDVSSINE
ncbi:hypothetical protein CLIB1423_24S00958 [[Candida] railenensis]|uniref:Zn(2)-C6 fungal-type domain-containing protein n=1 Tax=[Candida] railenensis TaxID=45579 RepID=A0A9P0QUQ3_9ASCO|nr:hypothetical protein CLIB1423_24S00958 [[Candida] railenensis]